MDDAALSPEAAPSRAALASPSEEGLPVHANGWTLIPITRIEDLRDAVYGAGLEAMQMARAPVTGSLAFAEHDGVVFSSGSIAGRAALRGPLSETGITLGIGLRLPAGTRHWLNEVETGDCGIFMPGDDHDALYASGSLYATATLTAERLSAIAEDRGLIVDLRCLGGTGVHTRRVPAGAVARLEREFEALHAGRHANVSSVARLGQRFIETILFHVGRQPRAVIGRVDPRGHARIVARARAYIVENLDAPLSIDGIARAAFTSRRTVYRAFNEVLDETPHSYVRMLRLHRIRHDLATDTERACTIALVANRWGIGELGRLSGWYRELFGERPSDTLAHARQVQAGRS